MPGMERLMNQSTKEERQIGRPRPNGSCAEPIDIRTSIRRSIGS
jgi:hypothetical protein